MKCNQCGIDFEGKFCPNCGAQAVNTQEAQPVNNEANIPLNQGWSPTQPVQKIKKPIYKKWWFWVIIAVFAIAVIAYLGGNGNTTENEEGRSNVSSMQSNGTTNSKKVEVTVVDFSSMDQAAIQSWADTNKVTCNITQENSDSVAKGSLISQSIKAGDTIHEGDTIKIVLSLGKKPSVEYTNALKQAGNYSKTLHMSKKAIYDQLISSYGGQFSTDAAQYAIDNVQADWNANALAQAKTYQSTMSMSKNAIYDQLTSEYGGKFTKEEAQYAIDHLDD